MSEYFHLHNHTHYSLQDGACTVEDLINATKKYDMKAVALTDHGVLYGVPEFYRLAKKNNIKPIIGMEAYITLEGSRTDKQKVETVGDKKKPYRHLILLAKNKIGYQNLMKLSSLGFLEGFYYRPRIDLELLKQYSEGIICSSACIGGIISPFLIHNQYDKAIQVSKTFKEIFGDDFYLELQDHSTTQDKIIIEQLPKLANELNIKLVATNDCHYINHEDAIFHNILVNLSDKTGEVDYTKLRYGTDQIYFKSQDEMISLFKKFKDAIDATSEIADKIDLNLDKKKFYFPVFPIPEESPAKTLEEYLELKARENLSKVYQFITMEHPDGTSRSSREHIGKEIEERFNYELDVIKRMGFAGYFLIVTDFIEAAKSMNVPVGPGRGSVAGSLIAYVLGITKVDPLQYNLLFERFLNPARKSMPDIDIDFADDQREKVIEYVRKKYGEKNVALIISFSTLSSKAVFKDVGRVLKIPLSTINNITKYIPSKFGRVASIDEALNNVPELKWVKESKDPMIQNLLKYSKELEGFYRNTSKHAAGVVIAPSEISNYVPLAKSENVVVTQFNKNELEDAGLLKMDFLGLKTLSIIRDAISYIQKNYNVILDIDSIPLDEKETYQLFWRGQTTGVFQFESAPMREYLKRLKPTSILDLAAMNALYRPGPMNFIDDFIDRKFGKKEIKYIHPILESILKETYGIIVYQEQVIQIANKVAGMSLAEADLLRKAMGKKDLKVMAQQKEKFIDGAVKNNISKNIASEIFDVIDKFANYGFNKSHAVSYSLLAYQTAYLKVHYPVEFMSSNLKNEIRNKDKIGKFLNDCRKLKIQVLPPNINRPSVHFEADKGKIIFGLSAIKNVGEKAVDEIIQKKQKLGRNIKSIFDFCANVDTRIINKRVLEGLILAGAFDSINKNRRQLFEAVEIALEYGNKINGFNNKNESSLFGESSVDVLFQEPLLPSIEDWNDKEKLSKEREVIGFYLTDHPLRKYELEFKSLTTIHFGEISEDEDLPDVVRACGVVNELNFKIDKKGNTMAFFKLDDLTGSCECMMFSSTYEKYKDILKEEEIFLMKAKPESSGDSVKLNIDEVFPIEEVKDKFVKYLRITILSNDEHIEHPIKYPDTIGGDHIGKEEDDINLKNIYLQQLEKLKIILEKNKGNIPVILEILNNGTSSSGFARLVDGVYDRSYQDGSRSRLFRLKSSGIKLTDKVITELNKIFGEDSLLLLPK